MPDNFEERRLVDVCFFLSLSLPGTRTEHILQGGIIAAMEDASKASSEEVPKLLTALLLGFFKDDPSALTSQLGLHREWFLDNFSNWSNIADKNRSHLTRGWDLEPDWMAELFTSVVEGQKDSPT